MDFSTVSGSLPLLSNLFFVCHRGDRKTWSSFRWLAGDPPDRTMSSLPAGRLRPGPVNGQTTLNCITAYRDHCRCNSDNLSDPTSDPFFSNFRDGAERRSIGSVQKPSCSGSGCTTNRCSVGGRDGADANCSRTNGYRTRDHDCLRGDLDLSVHQ